MLSCYTTQNKMSQTLPKLQTFLAHAGIASRRKAEEMIRTGQVKVNREVAHIGQRVDPKKDEVRVNNTPVHKTELRVMYLINKPVGIVSTTQDELGRKTVIDFLRQQLPPNTKLPRLYPVGRLDQDSEGLMILTNDGELAQHMTHPSFEVEKTYHVTVIGQPTEKALDHLARGVKLREGYTAPAQVEVLETSPDQTTLALTIHEGRYHQVKRMLLRVGYDVTKLVRVQMGEYTLDDLEGRKYKVVER